MRQVQLHKAMLMQEVQQLRSANVPKIEAYKRLNAEGKKISWPTLSLLNLFRHPIIKINGPPWAQIRQAYKDYVSSGSASSWHTKELFPAMTLLAV